MKIFKTVVRDCIAAKESTFTREPLLKYSPRATVTNDYKVLVDEYLERVNIKAEAI